MLPQTRVGPTPAATYLNRASCCSPAKVSVPMTEHCQAGPVVQHARRMSIDDLICFLSPMYCSARSVFKDFAVVKASPSSAPSLHSLDLSHRSLWTCAPALFWGEIFEPSSQQVRRLRLSAASKPIV